MNEIRRARIESVIMDELASIIPREVKDPRIHPLMITSVKASADASEIVILVILQRNPDAPLPEEEFRARMKSTLQGLHSASPFFRRHFSKILKIRQIPNFHFKEDKGFDNVARVHELLKQISSQERS